MAVIAAEGDLLTLCRNHEVSDDGPHIPTKGKIYDRQAQGGCTGLVFNTKTEQFEKSYVALSGTSRNCAGGVTPWGTWLTAEETVLGPDDKDKYNADALRKFEKTHGWVFEVPIDGSADAEPIKAMGRFVHEAVAVDRESGVVYLTEDRKTSGFYRYTPKTKGRLAEGGVLEMAELVGQSVLGGGIENGASFDVRWHKIDDPTLPHTPGTTR